MSAAGFQAKANQGAPLPRVESRLKVTGAARYAADVPVANLAHAVLVTSAIAKGRVTAIHLDAARRLPDVLEVLSYGDADELKPMTHSDSGATTLVPMQDRAIAHDGQIIALVVAETHEAAEEAAQHVTAEYELEQPAITIDSPGTETIPAVGNTRKMKEDPAVGDFEAVFRDAPLRHDAVYSTAPQHHHTMELFSTTAVWQDGELTVYEPSQGLYGMRHQLAQQLGLDPKFVRVVSPFVGGSFGGKGPLTARTAIVALAAKRLKRPVRCVVTRKQACGTQPFRAETSHHVRMCADKDGRLTGYSHEGLELTSRFDNYVSGGTHEVGRFYAYGSVKTAIKLVKADRQTPAYMRGPHEVPYCFALESAMDEMAEKVGMDPVEFRRLNDTAVDPITGRPYTTRSLMRCFDEAAKVFAWSKRNPAPGSMRDGDWLVGLGCASSFYPSNMSAAAVRARLECDGLVTVQTSAQEVGTGVGTVLVQMAAERLGIGVDKVRAEFGDSRLPPAPGAGASVSTASLGSALDIACERIRRQLLDTAVRAGPLKGRNPDELRLENGAVVDRDNTFQTFQDVLEAARIGAIEEYAEFIPAGHEPIAGGDLYRGSPLVEFGSYSRDKVTFAVGAEFVEVRVHARTKEIRVPRLVGAFAGGRIINARTAHSQLIGGFIWGVGAGLLESTEIDMRNGRYINGDLQDYYVPVNADINLVDVQLLEEVDQEVNGPGVKGIGEVSISGTNAAIANAIYHATGKRIRRAPVRLEELID